MPNGRMSARPGLYGKLPARGDFVRVGLPRDFVEPWDEWWQRGLVATRALAGGGWVAAWLEAPVWCFALPPGLLGRAGVVGVWLPSVDRVGRYFPLTIAATAPFAWTDRLEAARPFLAAAEQAGREAVGHDLGPDEVLRRAGAALPACGLAPRMDGSGDPMPGLASWWTAGSPRVAARAGHGPLLPEGASFAGLLDDNWAAVGGDVG